MNRRYQILLVLVVILVISLVSVLFLLPAANPKYSVTISNVIIQSGGAYSTFSPEASYSFSANSPQNCNNQAAYATQVDCENALSAIFWYNANGHGVGPLNVSNIQVTTPGFRVVNVESYNCNGSNCSYFPQYLGQGNSLLTFGKPIPSSSLSEGKYSEIEVGVLLIMPDSNYNGPLNLVISS